MAKGFKTPGSGRKKNTPNKATVARSQRIAEDERRSGRRIAIVRLAEAMEVYFGLAAKHQEQGPLPDEKKFLQFLKEGTKVAVELAPYQSPTLQKTVLRGDDAPDAAPIRLEVEMV